MSTSSNPIESSAACHAPRRPIRVFEGHTDMVYSAAYFPDGQRIASASEDRTVIIWDIESGRQNGQPLHHDSVVRWVAISPDGRRIASGTLESGLVIWDALTRQMVHKSEGGGVWRLAYSSDGRWIATVPIADENEIRLWDADTGRPSREPLKCGDDTYCVAFSPDGSRIAVGLDNGCFQVIDISTGESVVGPIKGHMKRVKSVAYSPDGCHLVTGSEDKSIRVWNSKTGLEVGKLGHKSEVNCISIIANGRRIAIGEGDTVRVWDLETGLQVGDSFDAPGWLGSVAFSPNGRYIASGGDDLYLFDTGSFAIQGSSSLPTTSNRNPPVRARACSVTSSVLDLPAVPEPVVQHQDDSGPSESEYDHSVINELVKLIDREYILPHQYNRSPSEAECSHGSSFDSILDPPVVLEPGNRRPNEERPHSPESIHRRLRITGPQPNPPREQETSTVQPAASAERSPPTTSARNALIQDRTHSVTSSILDLRAEQQGVHQAISHFCNALSNPQFSVSLAETPNDWLHANSLQILRVLSIHGKERVEVDLIYPVNQLSL
ncbi:WD40 repeat-like protein [Leucogyrophana mollusca]|uniref:WD40 repeat-like protein n=1 Tax=Leucogyrophana mollusca TaxID=85980 RepID=A0ACB8BBV7_9AGAM|nr:WD40 repeat-like protein [Leucogyrophana mollusca]